MGGFHEWIQSFVHLISPCTPVFQHHLRHAALGGWWGHKEEQGNTVDWGSTTRRLVPGTQCDSPEQG